jgi:hypothetical protein
MPGTLPGMLPNCAFAAGIDTTAAKAAREKVRLIANRNSLPPSHRAQILPGYVDAILASRGTLGFRP